MAHPCRCLEDRRYIRIAPIKSYLGCCGPGAGAEYLFGKPGNFIMNGEAAHLGMDERIEGIYGELKNFCQPWGL